MKSAKCRPVLSRADSWRARLSWERNMVATCKSHESSELKHGWRQPFSCYYLNLVLTGNCQYWEEIKVNNGFPFSEFCARTLPRAKMRKQSFKNSATENSPMYANEWSECVKWRELHNLLKNCCHLFQIRSHHRTPLMLRMLQFFIPFRGKYIPTSAI